MKFKWMALKPKLAHYCEQFYNNRLEMTFFLKPQDVINLSGKLYCQAQQKYNTFKEVSLLLTVVEVSL